MKKWAYIAVSIIVVIIAIFTGVYLFNNQNKNENQVQNQINLNTNTIEENIVNDTVVNEISVNSIEKEKISPNAVLILKKIYKQCGHTSKEYVQIPEEFVNLTKEELEEKYDDWELEKFASNEIILNRQVDGSCGEHYILREKEGIIAVYQINGNGDEILKEETGITVEYLTKSDQLKLQQGIRVDGKEALNTVLEDYE